MLSGECDAPVKRRCKQASVDRLCDYHRIDINGNRLTPGPERGQHQAARALIKWKKKEDKHSRGGKTWCNFVWSPHWPCVLSGRGPLITFKFLWAHEKTRHRFDKKWKKKNYGNTKWSGMRLWSSAFWYLVVSLCNNLLVVQFKVGFESMQACRERYIVQRSGEQELFIEILKNAKGSICHINDTAWRF